MIRSGLWIVIEGIDGAGKSSVLQTVRDCFLQRQLHCQTYREPGGTLLGEKIRTLLQIEHIDPIPMAELLLFYAARVQLLSQEILPALQIGQHVILDRHELSSFAYQSGAGGIDLEKIKMISAACMPKRIPDLTIYLSVTIETAMARMKHRGHLDRIESQSVNFLQNIIDAYQLCIEEYANVVTIDANRDYSQVQHDVSFVVQQLLKKTYEAG